MTNGKKEKWERFENRFFEHTFAHRFKNTSFVFLCITIQFSVTEGLLFIGESHPVSVRILYVLTRFGTLLSAVFYAFACVACRSYFRHTDDIAASRYRKRAVYNFCTGGVIYLLVISSLLTVLYVQF